ncbi:MAG: FliH/SctL family protein [Pseudomonadota bacterium]
MTQQRLQRFDFNSLRDFRGPIVMKTVSKEESIFVEPAAPVVPSFTQAQLDAATQEGRKAGYLEGFHAGTVDARKNFEAKTDETNSLVLSLLDTINALEQRYKALLQSEAKNLGALTLAIAKKVANEALDARGEQAITALVERCLPVVFSKPRLVIEVNPEMLAQTADRMEALLNAHDFEGEIHFKSNDQFATSDVSLDWGTGQVYRSTTELWAEIEALIDRIPLEMTFAETLDTTATRTGE